MGVVRTVRRMLLKAQAHPVVGIPQVLTHADTMTHPGNPVDRLAEPALPPTVLQPSLAAPPSDGHAGHVRQQAPYAANEWVLRPRATHIYTYSSTTSRVEQDGRAATGQPEGEDPSAGHGHQQRFAYGRSPPGPGPAYSPGRWRATATWRPPVRSGTLMDSAARTSGGELRRSPVEMGHALARTAVYVERGGADDHRHDQPMAARPPG